MYNIGIVGYSSGEFDTDFARSELTGIIEDILKYLNTGTNPAIVSGLTYVGIPAIAYDIADAMELTTVGIACEQASEYDTFPVDIEIIEGTNWGDESQTFINYIDCLIRIGGGEQSFAEVAMFRDQKPHNPVFEVELERK